MEEPRITQRYDLLGVSASAKLMGVSNVTVLNDILGGRLRAERIDARYFPVRADVERLAVQRRGRATKSLKRAFANPESPSSAT